MKECKCKSSPPLPHVNTSVCLATTFHLPHIWYLPLQHTVRKLFRHGANIPFMFLLWLPHRQHPLLCPPLLSTLSSVISFISLTRSSPFSYASSSISELHCINHVSCSGTQTTWNSVEYINMPETWWLMSWTRELNSIYVLVCIKIWKNKKIICLLLILLALW